VHRLGGQSVQPGGHVSQPQSARCELVHQVLEEEHEVRNETTVPERRAEAHRDRAPVAELAGRSVRLVAERGDRRSYPRARHGADATTVVEDPADGANGDTGGAGYVVDRRMRCGPDDGRSAPSATFRTRGLSVARAGHLASQWSAARSNMLKLRKRL